MISTIATFSLLAASALAVPAERRNYHGKYGYCLSDSEAQTIATNYGTLIASYTNELADKTLSPNFTDYSESVNTLINECPQGSAAITLPLLAPTFSNRTMFEVGQGQQAPINFQQLNIWHSCDSVTIRWETTNTANITNVKPVIGLIVMETCPAPAGNAFPYYIDTVYSEFDAGAWLENLMDAGICATASTSATPSTIVGAPVSATASTIVGAPVSVAPVITPTPAAANDVVYETDYTYTTTTLDVTTTIGAGQ